MHFLVCTFHIVLGCRAPVLFSKCAQSMGKCAPQGRMHMSGGKLFCYNPEHFSFLPAAELVGKFQNCEKNKTTKTWKLSDFLTYILIALSPSSPSLPLISLNGEVMSPIALLRMATPTPSPHPDAQVWTKWT